MNSLTVKQKKALHLFSTIWASGFCSNIKRSLVSILLFAFAIAEINAQSKRYHTAPLAFTDVNVVDVIEGKVITNQTVIISGDQITGIGHVDSLQIPVHARVIGARGKYLIPGLWDMHVHLDDLPYLHMTPEEKQIALPMYVANGVTGVRDMGGNLNQLNEWRLQARMEEIVAPTIVAAGPYIAGDPPAWPYNVLKVTSDDEARKAVRTLFSMSGVDFIKTYTLIPREAYFALSEEANWLGIPFAGHLPFEVTLEEAIDAGQRSFEHGDPIAYRCTERSSELQKIVLSATDMDQNNPDRARAPLIYKGRDWYVIDSFNANACKTLMNKLAIADVWYTPTNVIFNWMKMMIDTLMTDERFETLPPSCYEHWKKNRIRPGSGVQIKEFANSRLRLTAMLHDAGVSLLAGTDGPQLFYGFPGSSLHDEISLMVEAGLIPAESLRTATINPAEYFGKNYQMGTIAVGNTADLVLLNNNPIADIDNIRSVNSVVLRGCLLDRVVLDKMMNDVKTKVQEYNSREKGND